MLLFTLLRICCVFVAQTEREHECESEKHQQANDELDCACWATLNSTFRQVGIGCLGNEGGQSVIIERQSAAWWYARPLTQQAATCVGHRGDYGRYCDAHVLKRRGGEEPCQTKTHKWEYGHDQDILLLLSNLHQYKEAPQEWICMGKQNPKSVFLTLKGTKHKSVFLFTHLLLICRNCNKKSLKN